MLSKDDVEAYCKEYYSPIFKYCMSFLSNKEDAEDATQETFVTFSKKGHLIDEKHVKLWLYRTAHYKILQEYKKRYLKKDNECDFSEELMEASYKFSSFEENMISYYGERYAKAVYDRLSDREKELFELYSDGTLKTGEISKILGVDPHACSMRKKRLIEKCKDIMREILFY